MRKIWITLMICTITIFGCQLSETKHQVLTQPEVETSGFDSLLAAKYDADDYGMKKYVLAFLKTGPNRDLPTEEANKLQAAHMENIGRMAEEGDLIVAGPFYNNNDESLKGIYVFNVESIEEAKALTNTDPAIQAGSLVMELYHWYSSAALMGVNEVHEKISKSNP